MVHILLMAYCIIPILLNYQSCQCQAWDISSSYSTSCFFDIGEEHLKNSTFKMNLAKFEKDKSNKHIAAKWWYLSWLISLRPPETQPHTLYLRQLNDHLHSFSSPNTWTAPHVSPHRECRSVFLSSGLKVWETWSNLHHFLASDNFSRRLVFFFWVQAPCRNGRKKQFLFRIWGLGWSSKCPSFKEWTSYLRKIVETSNWKMGYINILKIR